MNKKTVIPTILFLIILPVSIFALIQEKSKKENEIRNQDNGPKIVLYYKDECGHCKNVDEWLEENNKEGKLVFSRKEVQFNKINAQEMIQRAQYCQLPLGTVGTPFLWDGENSRCVMGDEPIIMFFTNKLNAKQNAK